MGTKSFLESNKSSEYEKENFQSYKFAFVRCVVYSCERAHSFAKPPEGGIIQKNCITIKPKTDTYR